MSFGRLAVTIKGFFVFMKMTLNELKNNPFVKECLGINPRHKIIVVRYNDCDDSFKSINIGRMVAEFVRSKQGEERIPFQTKDYITKILNENIVADDVLKQYICLKNIGILFEKELGLDPTNIISNFSRNTVVILPWSGEIRNKTLFLNTAESNYSIKFEQTNAIII